MTEGAGEGDLGDYMVFRGEWRGDYSSPEQFKGGTGERELTSSQL